MVDNVWFHHGAVSSNSCRCLDHLNRRDRGPLPVGSGQFIDWVLIQNLSRCFVWQVDARFFTEAECVDIGHEIICTEAFKQITHRYVGRTLETFKERNAAPSASAVMVADRTVQQGIRPGIIISIRVPFAFFDSCRQGEYFHWRTWLYRQLNAFVQPVFRQAFPRIRIKCRPLGHAENLACIRICDHRDHARRIIFFLDTRHGIFKKVLKRPVQRQLEIGPIDRRSDSFLAVRQQIAPFIGIELHFAILARQRFIVNRFQAHFALGLHLAVFELFFHRKADQMGGKYTVRIKAFKVFNEQ